MSLPIKTSTALGLAGAVAGKVFKGRKMKILLVGIELGILIYAYIKAEQMNEQPDVE